MTVENCTDLETTTKAPEESGSSEDSGGSRRSFWKKRHKSGDSSSSGRRDLLGSSNSESGSGSSGYLGWNRRCLYPGHGGSGSHSSDGSRRRALLGYRHKSSDGTDQGSSDSSDDSDDGGFSDWFRDKCFKLRYFVCCLFIRGRLYIIQIQFVYVYIVMGMMAILEIQLLVQGEDEECLMRHHLMDGGKEGNYHHTVVLVLVLVLIPIQEAVMDGQYGGGLMHLLLKFV